jgi:adenylate cyclase
VRVDDATEVGAMQAGFNQMVAGLRERRHLADLFGRHVGEPVVERALQRGAVLGGETVEVAVLFVDIRGSTTLAAEREPTEVVECLNTFFATVVQVVEQHGGWVNKFEGDAALCVFGAPITSTSYADDALRAARALRIRLRELSALDAGIGVAAGPVVAGNIGSPRRFEYTVIGDPVNEAARLSEVAKCSPLRVAASDQVLARASAEEAAAWTDGDTVVLRGRTAPTTVAHPR